MPRSVTIIGPVPPPRGGVSLHVMRLRDLLRQCGHPVLILGWSGYPPGSLVDKILGALRQYCNLAWSLTTTSDPVIHLHYATLGSLIAVIPWVMGRRARWVLTLHSVRLLEDLDAAPGAVRSLVLRALHRFSLIICVRREIETAIQALNLKGPQTLLMPAFLPPSQAERDTALLPVDLQEAMGQRRRDNVVQVLCAAYYLGAGYGKDDLYGVELLAADLAHIAPLDGRSICLQVMVSNRPVGAAAEAAARLQDLVDGNPDLTLELRVDCPLVPALTLADVFVRPSREDGDSVAVREALAVGCSVLASDVVVRPDTVAVFPLDDVDRRRVVLREALGGAEASGPQAVDDSPYRAFAAALVGHPSHPEDSTS